MSTGIQLTTLRCPSCNSDFKIGSNTIFLYCGSCGSGYEIIDEKLSSVPVYFALHGQTQERFQPFWAFDARLNVTTRESKGFRHGHGLFRAFEEQKALRFYVPAFLEDLNNKPPRALQLTYDQPQMQFIQRQPALNGVTVSQRDARKIADYLIIGSEVEQPDTIRNLEFKLTLENPCIIGIAFS